MGFEDKFEGAGEIPRLIGKCDCMLAAKERGSGRPVTIHFLAAGRNEENRALLQQIERLPAPY